MHVFKFVNCFLMEFFKCNIFEYWLTMRSNGKGHSSMWHLIEALLQFFLQTLHCSLHQDKEHKDKGVILRWIDKATSRFLILYLHFYILDPVFAHWTSFVSNKTNKKQKMQECKSINVDKTCFSALYTFYFLYKMFTNLLTKLIQKHHKLQHSKFSSFMICKSSQDSAMTGMSFWHFEIVKHWQVKEPT